MKKEEISKPLVLFIRITENCNANCFMCGFAKSKKQLYVSDGAMNNIVTKAKQAGVKLVRFTGGEPLLHGKIFSFIKAFNEVGIKTSLITNGYLLPIKYKSLIDSGLDQIIVSLDANSSKLHDKLRNLPGLFQNAVTGIKKIKSKKKDIIVRVNTVVSPFNIGKLDKILDLLISLNVNQWSIIPLKGITDLWKKENQPLLISKYQHFQRKVATTTRPKLLGYSKQWAGRNNREIENYFKFGITFTPKGQCNLVNFVRFYIPFTDRLLPCNCVPWRLKEVKFNTQCGLGALTDNNLNPFVKFLHKNAHQTCIGCEPLNAYIGEHPEELMKDIYNF